MDKSRRARVLALQTLRGLWADFMEREPGTLRGEDPEQLHRMRVAHRRLRTAIAAFGDVLPAGLVEADPELRWIGQELGYVRDLDVQLEAMAEAAGRLEASPETVETLMAAIRGERETARARMLDGLTSTRFETLVLQIARSLREEVVAERASVGPTIGEVVPDMLEARYEKFRRSARKLTPNSPPEDMHRTRRRARRLRFATEFVAETYGEAAEDLVEEVKELQDLFGEHQDCFAAIELRHRVTASLPTEARSLTRDLDKQDRKRATGLRKAAPEAVNRVKKSWKRLKAIL